MNRDSGKNVFTKPELTVEDLSIALYQTNLKLAETNRRLIESEKKRSELLANISHDLRSPITTLHGYVEYLLSFEQPDEYEVFLTLNQMLGKLHSLDHLLNEMLLITSLDYPDDKFALRPIPIGGYLTDFFNSCKADKKYAQRGLLLKLPDNCPHYVVINPEMFARVLDNLFTNALKYSTQNDKIILEACLKGTDVIISVTDTGIGIDHKDLRRIFERTYMVSDSRTPGSGEGCGLGLSIAASIMGRHDGQIWCESTLGKGSTFYLSLPLYVPD